MLIFAIETAGITVFAPSPVNAAVLHLREDLRERHVRIDSTCSR